jgi:very-short-patch-repair endonuclease
MVPVVKTTHMDKGRNLRKTLEKRRALRVNQTNAESWLWRHLRGQNLGFKFVRQYGAGPFILDFYCPEKKVAVEVDGGQHNTEIGKFNDDARSEYLKNYGIHVIRFWNPDVLRNIDVVLETILMELQ